MQMWEVIYKLPTDLRDEESDEEKGGGCGALSATKSELGTQ
jgi:hypothetical protein